MRRRLIQIVKGAAVLVGAIILFLIVVVNFGTIETRLECSGEVRRTVPSGDAVRTPATLYARVETYRWFIVWTDHDAMIFWEVQPGGDNGFGYYRASQFETPITDFQSTEQYGSYSSLSNRIYVETAFDGSEVFDGICN